MFRISTLLRCLPDVSPCFGEEHAPFGLRFIKYLVLCGPIWRLGMWLWVNPLVKHP